MIFLKLQREVGASQQSTGRCQLASGLFPTPSSLPQQTQANQVMGLMSSSMRPQGWGGGVPGRRGIC